MAEQLQCIAFISMPGTGEWMVILFIGLLIFGRRLPEVARSLGKSVNEFKKGLRDFQDSADEVVSDVNRITNDVASDVKEAAELDTTHKDVQDYQHSASEGAGDMHGTGDDASQVQSTSDPGNLSTGESEAPETTGEVAGDAAPETHEGATPKTVFVGSIPSWGKACTAAESAVSAAPTISFSDSQAAGGLIDITSALSSNISQTPACIQPGSTTKAQ